MHETGSEMRISDWISAVCSSALQPWCGAVLFRAGRISTGQINGGGRHHHHVLGNGSGGRAVSLPRPQNLARLHGVAVPPGTRRNVPLRTLQVPAAQGRRSSLGILVSCRPPGPGPFLRVLTTSHSTPPNTVAPEDTGTKMK